MIRTIHRAQFVLAEADSLLPNAAVHVSDPGRISRIEPWNGPSPGANAQVVDWGNAIIVPGLVNTHTHLELTALHNELTHFSSFTDWLSQLIRKRRDWNSETYLESSRKGAELSLSAGTTLVGDISASGLTWQALQGSALRKVLFEEVVGFIPEKASQIVKELGNRLDRIEPNDFCGVSPHAPYSVSAELYRAVAGLARQREITLATHLAETQEELRFLESGTGEFVDFLGRLGALPAEWKAPGLTPVSYLEKLGLLSDSTVLIHCNYLDPDSMAKILSHRCSLVYCPRSHAFFGHEAHPVRQLLDLGVNVALGTDSLASNNSLSILDEMRFLYRERKDLKTEEILRMATLNGAAALRFGGMLGRLRRGYWADMTILGIPGSLSGRNLTAQILEGAGECIATIVRGEVAWKR